MTYYRTAYQTILSATSCTTLFCLRELPASTLTRIFASSPMAFANPIIDNVILHRLPSLSVFAHKFAKVPLLMGSVSDEGTSFTPLTLNTTQDFRDFVVNTDPGATYSAETIAKILAYYPNEPENQLPMSYELEADKVGAQYKRGVTFASDLLFIAGRRATAIAYVDAGQKVWSYRFDSLATSLGPRYGAYHGSELRFFFGNSLGMPAQHLPLLEEMRSRLGAFVRGDDPQGMLKRYGRERVG